MPPREGIYGLLAEFNTPGELVHATKEAHRAGYRRMECYTPYPVEEAAEALHFHKTRVPLVCLLGGLMGVTTAFLMETWVNVWAYPLNIAGRFTRWKSRPICASCSLFAARKSSPWTSVHMISTRPDA